MGILMIFDAIVIGSGPAGNMTARALAERGKNTLIIEKQKTVGKNVHCAGGIIGGVLERLNIEKKLRNYDAIKTDIRKLNFISPHNKASIDLGRVIGHTVDRSLFDQCLSDLAVDYGAKLYTNTRFISIKYIGREIAIEVKKDGNFETLKTRILVGCDGVNSSVARQAGIYVPKKHFGYAWAYDMDNVVGIEHDEIEIYFSNLTPGGYAWIFPKGEHLVNFGAGGIGITNFYYKKVFKYLLRKSNKISHKFKNSKKVRFTGGVVPVSNPPKSCVRDNILIVGDAGNQINSTTAEGIRYALICGNIAGLVINNALENGLNFLKYYDKYWRQILRSETSFSNQAREVFLRLDNNDYDLTLDVVKKLDFEKVMSGQWITTIIDIIRNKPSVIKIILSRFKPLDIPR
jgi:digeranylgeranylglycerophospholipid reductase